MFIFFPGFAGESESKFAETINDSQYVSISVILTLLIRFQIDEIHLKHFFGFFGYDRIGQLGLFLFPFLIGAHGFQEFYHSFDRNPSKPLIHLLEKNSNSIAAYLIYQDDFWKKLPWDCNTWTCSGPELWNNLHLSQDLLNEIPVIRNNLFDAKE